jgi:hypothetical protein
MAYCKKCKRIKSNYDFLEREDREGLYSWCIECMVKYSRRVDFPPKDERGFGKSK